MCTMTSSFRPVKQVDALHIYTLHKRDLGKDEPALWNDVPYVGNIFARLSHAGLGSDLTWVMFLSSVVCKQHLCSPNEDLGTSKNIQARHFVSTFHQV